MATLAEDALVRMYFAFGGGEPSVFDEWLADVRGDVWDQCLRSENKENPYRETVGED